MTAQVETESGAFPPCLDRDVAFHGLYVTLYPRIARYCYRLVRNEELARDITQEAFARVLARWRTVREPEPYLFLVATNLVRTAMRQASREQAALAASRATFDVVGTSIDEHFALHDAVDHLPRRYREVVLLHYFADLPVTSVAAAVRRPIGTVKRQLSEARGLMASYLGAWDGATDLA